MPDIEVKTAQGFFTLFAWAAVAGIALAAVEIFVLPTIRRTLMRAA